MCKGSGTRTGLDHAASGADVEAVEDVRGVGCVDDLCSVWETGGPELGGGGEDVDEARGARCGGVGGFFGGGAFAFAMVAGIGMRRRGANLGTRGEREE